MNTLVIFLTIFTILVAGPFIVALDIYLVKRWLEAFEDLDLTLLAIEVWWSNLINKRR